MIDLYKRFGNQPSSNQNPQISEIVNAFNFLKNARNPQAMFLQMMQRNPMYQSAMNYINQNGGDAQKAFYSMAEQCGVNPDDIINMLH